MNETWENAKKNLIWDPILTRLHQTYPLKIISRDLALLVVKRCSKLLYYAIYRKTNEPHLRKLWKT